MSNKGVLLIIIHQVNIIKKKDFKKKAREMVQDLSEEKKNKKRQYGNMVTNDI